MLVTINLTNKISSPWGGWGKCSAWFKASLKTAVSCTTLFFPVATNVNLMPMSQTAKTFYLVNPFLLIKSSCACSRTDIGMWVPSIAPMHPSKYGENWCSLGCTYLNSGSIGLIIVRAKETTASNTSPNFQLTVSNDLQNLSHICLWHCLVPRAHRNIPNASTESHCRVDFSPWLDTKIECNNWNADGWRRKFL